MYVWERCSWYSRCYNSFLEQTMEVLFGIRKLYQEMSQDRQDGPCIHSSGKAHASYPSSREECWSHIHGCGKAFFAGGAEVRHTRSTPAYLEGRLFIHLFYKYLFNPSYVLGPMPGSGDTEMNWIPIISALMTFIVRHFRTRTVL